MIESKSKRGGRRPGAGRPATERTPLNTMADPETRRRLAAIDPKPWRAIEIAAQYYEETKMNAYQRVFEQATQSAYDDDELLVVGLENGQWVYRPYESPESDQLGCSVRVDAAGPVRGFEAQHAENLEKNFDAEEIH